MGCDIHSFAEIKIDGKWQRVFEQLFTDYGDKRSSEPFGWRSYAIFGFLADVRNYSSSPVIASPKGLPEDSEWLNSPWKYAHEKNPMNGELIPHEERETNKQVIGNNFDYHSHSWLTLKELMQVDYSATFENRRVNKTYITPGQGTVIDGRAQAAPGEGTKTTLREFLGKEFFECVLQLQMIGPPEDVRIVFYFDN